MDTTDTGTDAGSTSLLEQLEAEDRASQADDALELTEEVPEGAEAPPAPEPKPDDANREPLTVEEYQKRHENLNGALRQERNEKREIRSELETLKAQIAEMRETQPQQFHQFSLDQQISQFDGINWQAWSQADPQQAQQAWQQYERLLGQREQAQQQRAQQEQQRQQQVQQQMVNNFYQAIEQSEAAFIQQKPDYQDAIEFLKTDLAKEGNRMGYFGANADAYAHQTMMEIGARLYRSGVDPAEFAYNQAIERGYAAKTADLASLQAGAQAAVSISNLGGKSSNEGGSMEETMAGLSGAAARDFWKKVKAQGG